MSPGRLSIAQRAVISFGLIALLVLLQGLFALKQVAQVRATGQYTENISLPSTRYLGEIRDLCIEHSRTQPAHGTQPRPQGARGHGEPPASGAGLAGAGAEQIHPPRGRLQQRAVRKIRRDRHPIPVKRWRNTKPCRGKTARKK